MRFAFIAKHRGDLAGVVALRGARCVVQWLSCMAVARAKRANAE